jgi:hypothetical protein
MEYKGKLYGRVGGRYFDTGCTSDDFDNLKKENERLKIKVNGKCPKDGRMDRPIYITMNNKRTLAVADGEGHAYKVYGEGYEVYGSVCKPENKYDPSDYEFERGLSGMDF